MIPSTEADRLREKIANLLIQYYTAYYRDQLGLPDWECRVKHRQEEERLFAEPAITKIEQWFDYDFHGKRVLVVGAGSGAESIALARRGADVWGIEPNAQALYILHLKARLHGISTSAFLRACAESIPFSDASFDLIYCYTVLEHVQSVERALDEMIRSCKVGGHVFILAPDYRFPYEEHYKLKGPPFGPKWVWHLYLRLLGRPTEFLKSLNFVTAPALDRLLWKRNVTSIRVFEPRLLTWEKRRSYSKWFCQAFAIQRHQWIFLKKRSA
jgi:ubiquinone/menaquinone biosynthesis C-methylase UbiE